MSEAPWEPRKATPNDMPADAPLESAPEFRNAPPDVEMLYVSNFRGFETKGSRVEVRSRDTRTIGGYAAVFGKRSVNLGGFHEVLDPKTFNKSRADGFPGVICRFNHSDDLLLGTTRAGTCRLSIDGNGLQYEVDVPQCRNDVYEMTERGDIAHSSFAFQAYEDDWSHDDSGYPVRMLLSARLIDVAPVTNPAYPDATVGVRSLATPGLRSLARHMDVPIEDVIERAQRDELRSFFIRTDNRSGLIIPDLEPITEPAESESDDDEPTVEPEATESESRYSGKFGPAALMEILGRRADDPIVA